MWIRSKKNEELSPGKVEAFDVAMVAYEAEMARSLRSLAVWRRQLGWVAIGMLRAFAMIAGCVLVVELSGLFTPIGVTIGLFIGLLIFPVSVMVFPGAYFHNEFSARAWAAFDKSFKEARDLARLTD
jgi:hypothetical protein